MTFYGDFRAAQTVRVRFNTVNNYGTPTTLTSGAVIVSKDGADITPSGGVTLTTDVGGVTGRHHVVLDTSIDATSFSKGSEYAVRLSGSSSVGGTSVFGIVVGEFSIENRSLGDVALGLVATAVWNALRTTMTTVGSIGKDLSTFLTQYVGGGTSGGSGGTNAIQDLLALLFTNTAFAHIGDTTGLPGSGAAGNFYLSLHSASPVGGNQTTNEATYTGYVRIGIVRTSTGWTVTGVSTTSANVVNAAVDTFGTVTGGSGTLTHLVIGRDAAGAGQILYILPLATAFTITANNRPYFAAGAISVTLQ